jgi:exopolysaccharide biosynthesis protein
VHQGDDRARLWNAVAGSAQIVTGGRVTVPVYRDAGHPEAELTEGSPSHFSNADSWYERVNARSAIGLTGDGKTLILFVVDRSVKEGPGGSQGLKVSEMARLLAEDYHAAEALNLDGGGSSSLAMEDPKTHERKLVNASSDNPKGRSVGSNLAVFVPVSQ